MNLKYQQYDWAAIMADTKVEDASSEPYDHDKYPTLWYFSFPHVEGLPVKMGEHADTKEEATKLVLDRLRAFVAGEDYSSIHD